MLAPNSRAPETNHLRVMYKLAIHFMHPQFSELITVKILCMNLMLAFGITSACQSGFQGEARAAEGYARLDACCEKPDANIPK